MQPELLSRLVCEMALESRSLDLLRMVVSLMDVAVSKSAFLSECEPSQKMVVTGTLGSIPAGIRTACLVKSFIPTHGGGSKFNSWGYAGFSLWFHLPRCHFWYIYLSHSHMSSCACLGETASRLLFGILAQRGSLLGCK